MMPSMPFAVIYSGEQPGSAVSFAVVSPLVWWKIRVLAGLLAVLSLSTYLIITPYLFLTPEFWAMTKIVLGVHGASTIVPTSPLT